MIQDKQAMFHNYVDVVEAGSFGARKHFAPSLVIGLKSLLESNWWR